MEALLDSVQHQLQLLFEQYQRPGELVLAARELQMLCCDFRICPFFVTEPELLKLVKWVKKPTADSQQNLQLSFDEFQVQVAGCFVIAII